MTEGETSRSPLTNGLRIGMLHAMSGFGETLRQERESRGFTLESLSEATKVGLPLLEALETNDFARLPGGPFNHGFVRAIARTLDLDPELVIEAYDQEAKSQGIRTPDPGASMAPVPRRVLARAKRLDKRCARRD